MKKRLLNVILIPLKILTWPIAALVIAVIYVIKGGDYPKMLIEWVGLD